MLQTLTMLFFQPYRRHAARRALIGAGAGRGNNGS